MVYSRDLQPIWSILVDISRCTCRLSNGNGYLICNIYDNILFFCSQPKISQDSTLIFSRDLPNCAVVIMLTLYSSPLFVLP